jgi:arginase
MSITVLDAPSNLGLRAPAPGVVPGCYKLAGALRDQGLLTRIGARDAGVVVPPRYDVGRWKAGDGVLNASALARYTPRLADRVVQHVAPGGLLIVLGGDCSILLGAMLGLRRLGRYGLVYLDGHSDFRHLGNAPHVGASAGEGLALLTGRGQADITDIEHLGPYVREEDVAVLGVHEPDDPTLEEVRRHFRVVREAAEMKKAGCGTAATAALAALRTRPDAEALDGIWVHLDADVLDPSVMPAVDSPDPGGLTHEELVEVLTVLLAEPRTVGLNLTVYDPDLDEDGTAGAALADGIVEAVTASGR